MARPQKPQLQQQQQQPQHVESQLRCQSEYICFFSGFFLQLLFTFKLLRIHFNWFSYKLLKICRFFQLLLLLIFLWAHLSWSFGDTYTHTYAHWRTLGTVYKRRHARTHRLTHTHIHTHTWARAGDAKKAIGKFIVVVDSDAWLDSSAGVRGSKGSTYFYQFSNSFSLQRIVFLYVCFIFWFNWEF